MKKALGFFSLILLTFGLVGCDTPEDIGGGGLNVKQGPSVGEVEFPRTDIPYNKTAMFRRPTILQGDAAVSRIEWKDPTGEVRLTHTMEEERDKTLSGLKSEDSGPWILEVTDFNGITVKKPFFANITGGVSYAVIKRIGDEYALYNWDGKYTMGMIAQPTAPVSYTGTVNEVHGLEICPNGDCVLFETKDAIGRVTPDGAELEEITPPGGIPFGIARHLMLSPDGETLAYIGGGHEDPQLAQLYTLRLDGVSAPEQLTRFPHGVTRGVWVDDKTLITSIGGPRDRAEGCDTHPICAVKLLMKVSLDGSYEEIGELQYPNFSASPRDVFLGDDGTALLAVAGFRHDLGESWIGVIDISSGFSKKYTSSDIRWIRPGFSPHFESASAMIGIEGDDRVIRFRIEDGSPLPIEQPPGIGTVYQVRPIVSK